MSSIGLQIGLRSLLASRTALETIGHNVANVNTPGYSRQVLDITSGRSLSVGNLQMGVGVDVQSIQRSIDKLLQGRIGSQSSILGMLESRIVKMSEVEALFGEPSEFGMGARMSALFSELSNLSANAGDPVLRTGVVEEAKSLTSRFNLLSNRFEKLEQDSFSQIRTVTNSVNQIADKIALLNQEISTVESSGSMANDMRDQRDVALQQLAQMVNIESRETEGGRVRVLVGGRLLVGQNKAYDMDARSDLEGNISLHIDGHPDPVDIQGGEIGGLLQFVQDMRNKTVPDLDTLASNLIYEFNRAHSTGVPPGGSFKFLDSEYLIEDSNLNGNFLDERLNSSGLPFQVANGSLRVNVVDESTGLVETTEIQINADEMTIGDLVNALNAIPSINASVNELGALQVASDVGFGFDFSARLDREPNRVGTLGGGQASLGTGSAPFFLSNGQTLDITGPGGPFTVSFASSEFENISQATAEEIAAVLNSDAGMNANGMRAVVVDDRVVLQTLSSGSSASFTVTGGTALGGLGLSSGMTVSGHDTSLAINVTGEYGGDENDRLTFVPTGDGTIGSTPNLHIDVFNSAGVLVQSIPVGDGYQPGTEVELLSGLRISFGVGEVSSTNGDVMALDLVKESDSAGVLAALGLNSLFTGTDAATIAVRGDLELNPNLLALSGDGTPGDNGIILQLLELEDKSIGSLGQASLGEYYGGVISDVAFQIESGKAAYQVEFGLTESLVQRRDQMSGVNIDEELVNMIQFEQAFQASSRFLQVVNQLNDDLLAIL